MLTYCFKVCCQTLFKTVFLRLCYNSRSTWHCPIYVTCTFPNLDPSSGQVCGPGTGFSGRVLSHWSQDRECYCLDRGDQNILGTRPKNYISLNGTHFCHTHKIWYELISILENWDCDNSNVTTMNLSSGKYDILKMSIFKITIFFLHHHPLVAEDRALHHAECSILIFLSTLPVVMMASGFWDEMEPRALTWSPSHSTPNSTLVTN